MGLHVKDYLSGINTIGIKIKRWGEKSPHPTKGLNSFDSYGKLYGNKKLKINNATKTAFALAA